jgi:hypothetical protein
VTAPQWGDGSLATLCNELEELTGQLATACRNVAVDESVYWQNYWACWANQNPTDSVAARDKACQAYCAKWREQVFVAEGVREALHARQRALIAVLAART